MKKQILTAALVLGMATSVYAAFAPGTGVQLSPHDMNTIAANTPDDQGRICAFCHTPHHAIDTTTATEHTYLPLWSHTPNNDTNFTAYGTGDGNVPFSPTLDLTYEADILVGPSRLCMSCHDGVIAVDQHYGTLFPGTNILTNQDGFGQAGIAAVDSLSNDHPIGFDYLAVAGAAAKGTPGGGAGLDPYINPESSTFGIPGFANTNAPTMTVQDRLFNGSIMTCATCHDVHNRKNATNVQNALVNKFVLAPQDSSALCQTCHIK